MQLQHTEPLQITEQESRPLYNTHRYCPPPSQQHKQPWWVEACELLHPDTERELRQGNNLQGPWHQGAPTHHHIFIIIRCIILEHPALRAPWINLCSTSEDVTGVSQASFTLLNSLRHFNRFTNLVLTHFLTNSWPAVRVMAPFTWGPQPTVLDPWLFLRGVDSASFWFSPQQPSRRCPCISPRFFQYAPCKTEKKIWEAKEIKWKDYSNQSVRTNCLNGKEIKHSLNIYRSMYTFTFICTFTDL